MKKRVGRDLEGVREGLREAGRRRWEQPIYRISLKERQRKRELAKDLKLLARVIQSERIGIAAKERNRSRALEAYHRRAEQINLRRRLPGLFRQAVRAGESLRREKARRPAQLEKAFRRAFIRASNQVERKIRKRLCSRFEKAMKSRSASSVILRLSGTSLAGIRAHLETLFAPGMAWENHGQGLGFWNIDHIRPLASFRLSEPGQPEAAFHFTNLQPLWHEENMQKGCAYP